ncbi:sensor histidine kinase [Portibacter marinus]|uniref:sensor histidine kinase n=1 Tax=Portibacter marinus TaxID=2898660 RepID=UPI001F346548|nr:histidine kinase [Portibacter marinus]
MIKTGDRNFWIAQLIGWGIFASMNFFVQYLSLKNSGELQDNIVWVIVNSAVAFFGGLILTTIYRYYLKSQSINLLNFKVTLRYIVIGTLVLTIAFLGLVAILLLFAHDGRIITLLEFFGNFFIFGVLMLIWNSIYFMIHYLHSWKNAESEKWQLVATMKEAQLGNLKAQINPHFMFNAINNIRALISEDAEKAKLMLLNFSDMFRYALIHNNQSLVTLRNEIEIVKKYLELLSIQFEEKLSYAIHVDQDLLDEKVPPMMLQLLVENAVKHGISELPGGGTVKVNVSVKDDQIILRVSNSGSLNSSSDLQQKLGVGLRNISERLRLLYGTKGKLHLGEGEGMVTAEVSYPKMVLV